MLVWVMLPSRLSEHMAGENLLKFSWPTKKVLLWRDGWVGLSKVKLFHIFIFIEFAPSPKPPLINEWQGWFESCFNYNCPRIWRGRTFDWCTTERHFQWILSTAEWLSRLQRVQKILAKLERVWSNQKTTGMVLTNQKAAGPLQFQFECIYAWYLCYWI